MLKESTSLWKEGVYHRQLDQDGRMPVQLFLPQSYEPRYPYPLLVFLHGHGERETQWINAVPALSRRNYICIGLRGTHALDGRDGEVGYGWGRNRRCDSAIEEYVLSAVHDTMRITHIHTERVFLAGFCEGATIAYRLGLNFADRFAGVIALNGWLPSGPLPLANPSTRRLKVFVGHGEDNEKVQVDKAYSAYRLLYSAGLDVEMRTYDSDHRLVSPMLQDVNRWILKVCQQPF